jgi:hypothetical protein
MEEGGFFCPHVQKKEFLLWTIVQGCGSSSSHFSSVFTHRAWGWIRTDIWSNRLLSSYLASEIQMGSPQCLVTERTVRSHLLPCQDEVCPQAVVLKVVSSERLHHVLSEMCSPKVSSKIKNECTDTFRAAWQRDFMPVESNKTFWLIFCMLSKFHCSTNSFLLCFAKVWLVMNWIFLGKSKKLQMGGPSLWKIVQEVLN